MKIRELFIVTASIDASNPGCGRYEFAREENLVRMSVILFQTTGKSVPLGKWIETWIDGTELRIKAGEGDANPFLVFWRLAAGWNATDDVIQNGEMMIPWEEDGL